MRGKQRAVWPRNRLGARYIRQDRYLNFCVDRSLRGNQTILVWSLPVSIAIQEGGRTRPGWSGYLGGVSRTLYANRLHSKETALIPKITRSYGKDSNLLIIENIPAVSCSSSGETYLTADTLHEIERIKLHRKYFAVFRSVPVAEFVLFSANRFLKMRT